jgi:hypothetical protein
VEFSATEHSGTWGLAQPIPGIAGAELIRVSCRSTGNCTAVGDHPDTAAAFVINQSNGVWGSPIPVRGLGALPGGGAASATFGSLSCPSAGNCAAVGFYFDQARAVQPFVVTQKNGIWGRARVLPGLARLNIGKFAESTVLACRSASNCSVGGAYFTAGGRSEPFLAIQKNGIWAKAREVTGFH